eukprot:269033-Amphidinium_carterae.2
MANSSCHYTLAVCVPLSKARAREAQKQAEADWAGLSLGALAPKKSSSQAGMRLAAESEPAAAEG